MARNEKSTEDKKFMAKLRGVIEASPVLPKAVPEGDVVPTSSPLGWGEP